MEFILELLVKNGKFKTHFLYLLESSILLSWWLVHGLFNDAVLIKVVMMDVTRWLCTVK